MDDFERPGLADGPVAWEAKGTWEVQNGQLVNRSKNRDRWPNESVRFRAPRAMPAGGIVRLDALHDGVHRTPGYLSLLARDSESKAYVEWVSSRNAVPAGYRTTATAPEIKPPAAPCHWVGRQFATYAIRWKGYDEKTGKGSVELLFAAKADAELAAAVSVEVPALQKLDQFELVLNSEDQAGAAPTVAFDNFRLELSEGPELPAGFSARAGADSRLHLSWQDVPDEDGYVLQRATGPAGEWQDLPRLPANTTEHEDREAQPSVLYRYRLRAENNKGQSSWTASVEAFVPGPPLAPAGLRVQAYPSGLTLIEWQDNAINEVHFVVEREASAGAPWQTLNTTPANLATVEDWLPPGATFRYRVRAVNELGVSPWAGPAEAQRPKPPPTIVAPASRIVYSRQEDLPVTSVEVVFDQPVKCSGGPADYAVTAVKHPWHPIALPEPEIASVTYDQQRRRARLVFTPPIPDLVEYRIEVRPTVTGLDGVPVAAAPVRVAVLVGDDDRDGFVPPAAGQRLGKRLAMPPMPIGIMAEDIEWNTENGAHNVEYIGELMDAYKGIDSLRVNLWWDVLEPEQGKFDPKYVGFLRRVLAAAEQRQLPLEIGLRQVRWPLWVCNHKGFHNALYDPRVAPKLADTWQRLAAICHEYPVVFGYWIISEEYPTGGDLRNYLSFVDLVSKALRVAHPGCVVKVRPAAAPFQGGNEVTPTVTQRGAQDLCMAAGIYPTGWQWDIANPDPLSTASFSNITALRYYASEVQGGPNGLGEIGFRAAPGASFGDPERLVAFQRVMALAYDIGLLEYVIWGESWTFSDPAAFFPRLVAFRDLLTRQPRARGFDLCLVNDTKADFAHPPYRKQTELDLSGVFCWLEERGYRFCLAAAPAVPLLKGEPKASVKLSELAKLGPAERLVHLHRALAGVARTGVVLPWLARASRYQSLTGLPCDLEVQFPGARGTCDALSLSPTRLQVYAPPGTLVRWRRPGEAGDWNDLVTARDSSLTIVDLEARK